MGMDIIIAVSLVAVAGLAAFVALRIHASRQANAFRMEAGKAKEADADVFPVMRQVNVDEFNVADYSGDRSVLVNDLMVESQRVSRKLEFASNALREDVATMTGLNDRIIHLQSDLQTRADQMRELELRLNEQRNETIRVIEEKGQLEDRTEELEIELSRRANTLDATKEALLSMENSYRDLLSQNNGLKGEMAHLQHDVQSAQSRISDMNITLEQRETDMHRVNMELAEVRTDVTSERNRASLAESKVTRLMKQLEELKSETENDLDRYRSERDIMKVKHDQAQDAVEAIRQRLADTERNRDRALSQVETLRNEIAAHRAEMSTKASSLETSNRELSSHITVLERILEQYRMKPVTSGQSSADAARLRVVAAREGETG
jgi:chromosome segregation ATPase